MPSAHAAAAFSFHQKLRRVTRHHGSSSPWKGNAPRSTPSESRTLGGPRQGAPRGGRTRRACRACGSSWPPPFATCLLPPGPCLRYGRLVVVLVPLGTRGRLGHRLLERIAPRDERRVLLL